MGKINILLCWICVSFCSSCFLSCSQPRNADKTLSEILEKDSIEVYDMLQKLRHSNIHHIWIAVARYESGQKPQGFELTHRQKGAEPIRLTGSLNYWDDVKREDWEYSTVLAHSDTLDMIKDFSEILQVCKKIADGKEIIFLSAHNKLPSKEEFSDVQYYVTMLFYYQKEHYFLAYTNYNLLNNLLEYEKEQYYPDLDYVNKCTRVMDNVYLIGFSSQDEFFKNH